MGRLSWDRPAFGNFSKGVGSEATYADTDTATVRGPCAGEPQPGTDLGDDLKPHVVDIQSLQFLWSFLGHAGRPRFLFHQFLRCLGPWRFGRVVARVRVSPQVRGARFAREVGWWGIGCGSGGKGGAGVYNLHLCHLARSCFRALRLPRRGQGWRHRSEDLPSSPGQRLMTWS